MNMASRRTLDTPRPPRTEWRTTPQALSFRRFGEPARATATATPASDPAPRREQPPAAPASPDAVSRATAEAAHDFNNLLSVILTCAGELEGLGLEETQRERVAEIRAAAEREEEIEPGMRPADRR